MNLAHDAVRQDGVVVAGAGQAGGRAVEAQRAAGLPFQFDGDRLVCPTPRHLIRQWGPGRSRPG
jgi:hypothetical protein